MTLNTERPFISVFSIAATRIESASVAGTITMTYLTVFQRVDHITGSRNIAA